MSLSEWATLEYLKNQGFDFAGQVVSVRVDLNVLTKEGKLKVPEPLRIKSLTGLLDFAVRERVKLVLLSHAEVDKVFPSLLEAAMAIPRVTGVDIPVHFVDAITGEKVEEAVKRLEPGSVLVLENVRQDPRETAGDLSLAHEVFEILGKPRVHILNNLDIAHRPKHALVGLYPKFVKENGGYYLPSDHLLSQIKEIDEVVSGKEIVFVLAGAKDKDKVALLAAQKGRPIKAVIPGGGFLNSLLAARGFTLNPQNKGADEKQIKNAKEFMDSFAGEIILPIDLRVADVLTPGTVPAVVEVEKLNEYMMIGDIGPETEQSYDVIITELAEEGYPIVANCGMGKEDFSLSGTFTLIKSLREASEHTQVLIIGDDSNKLVDKAIKAGVIPDRGTMRKSTAGGAAAEYIATNGNLEMLNFTKKEEIH